MSPFQRLGVTVTSTVGVVSARGGEKLPPFITELEEAAKNTDAGQVEWCGLPVCHRFYTISSAPSNSCQVRLRWAKVSDFVTYRFLISMCSPFLFSLFYGMFVTHVHCLLQRVLCLVQLDLQGQRMKGKPALGSECNTCVLTTTVIYVCCYCPAWCVLV